MENKYKQGGYQSPPVNYGTFNSEWISKKIDTDCIEFCEKFGEYLAKNGLTTSQIRNVFGELKRIELQSDIELDLNEKGEVQKNKDGQKLKKFKDGVFEGETAFLLLKPKIAYAAKRKGGDAMNKFKEEIDKAHKATFKENKEVDAGSFKRFCEFFEAILAYHKASGGRD